jgi:hypothetical protein
VVKLARFVVLAIVATVSGAESQTPDRVPVVVELFTSEGCSSCPPADQVLGSLAKAQPVAGVQVIPLGMHVTYWDSLGWKDPASLALATSRQQDYGRIFGGDRVYTPQAVIDGQQEVVGSDEAGVKRAIARAAAQPHARVTVAPAPASGSIGVRVTVSELPAGLTEPLDVWWFVTEDGITTAVKRGENGGRTLRHEAVVRLSETYRIANGAASMPARELRHGEPPSTWRRDNLRAVVIVQGRNSRRIWGAATTPLK